MRVIFTAATNAASAPHEQMAKLCSWVGTVVRCAQQQAMTHTSISANDQISAGLFVPQLQGGEGACSDFNGI